MYVSKHCLSCNVARQYFVKKGIQYEEVDITNNQIKFEEMLSLGGIATPLIIIGDQIIHSFDSTKLDKALEEFI